MLTEPLQIICACTAIEETEEMEDETDWLFEGFEKSSLCFTTKIALDLNAIAVMVWAIEILRVFVGVAA